MKKRIYNRETQCIIKALNRKLLLIYHREREKKWKTNSFC